MKPSTVHLVEGPKALCELQGYVYDAWASYGAKSTTRWAGPAARRNFRAKAGVLFTKFNETFWNEARRVLRITHSMPTRSRSGRSLPTPGNVSGRASCRPSGRVRVADRLLKPDMWSGWGIRTLSADHKNFNPFNYQTGAVWPHDNGFIAQGMSDTAFTTKPALIAEAITRAAGYFALRSDARTLRRHAAGRLPTSQSSTSALTSRKAGPRDRSSRFLQAMLGFQPDAPHERLYVDPALPDWMN